MQGKCIWLSVYLNPGFSVQIETGKYVHVLQLMCTWNVKWYSGFCSQQQYLCIFSWMLIWKLALKTNLNSPQCQKHQTRRNAERGLQGSLKRKANQIVKQASQWPLLPVQLPKLGRIQILRRRVKLLDMYLPNWSQYLGQQYPWSQVTIDPCSHILQTHQPLAMKVVSVSNGHQSELVWDVS